MADFTFLVSRTLDSKYSATLPKISDNAPDASPASTIEMNNVLKALGNFFTASEKELPDEISARTSRITMRNT